MQPLAQEIWTLQSKYVLYFHQNQPRYCPCAFFIKKSTISYRNPVLIGHIRAKISFKQCTYVRSC